MRQWPELEWRRVCAANAGHPEAAFNLQIRDLRALLEELDETRRLLQREQTIVDRLLRRKR